MCSIWSTIYQQETRKFIVEYSADGITYQASVETLADKNLYAIKHYALESRPTLYRMRLEQVSGKFYYSQPVLLVDAERTMPVKIYPTIVSGSSVIVETKFSVEELVGFDEKGTHLFQKEFGEINERFSVQLPALSKGVYWANLIGRQGWKYDEKFIVP